MVQDQRIQILDSVYKELNEILTKLKEHLLNSLTDKETTFFDDFQKIVDTVFSKEYDDVTADLNKEGAEDLENEELTKYYNIVKEFVDLLAERLLPECLWSVPLVAEYVGTKAKGLMSAWLVRTDGPHTLHYIWPTKSRRITWYKCAAHTDGIDIGGTVAGTGEPVYAVIGGTLTVAAEAWTTKSLSSYVIISGDDGREYRYVHMIVDADILKKAKESDDKDKRVEAGTVLGQMSNIGNFYDEKGEKIIMGIHLHFEIREGGVPQNPLDFFPNIAVIDCDKEEDNVAGNERVLIYKAPVKWTYQRKGRFKAESGAMLKLLDQYVNHKGLTWKNAKYEKDPTRDIETVILKVDDIVYFPSDVISASDIEEKLAELGHMVNVPVIPDEVEQGLTGENHSYILDSNGDVPISKIVDPAKVAVTLATKNIDEFIKGNKSFDDVLDDYATIYADKVHSNKRWKWREGILGRKKLRDTEKSRIRQHAREKELIPDRKVTKVTINGKSYNFADFASVVYKRKKLPKDLWLAKDGEQFDYLNELIGGKKEGYTWHHTEHKGIMELIPLGIHRSTKHDGGRAPEMWSYALRHKKKENF